MPFELDNDFENIVQIKVIALAAAETPLTGWSLPA